MSPFPRVGCFFVALLGLGACRLTDPTASSETRLADRPADPMGLGSASAASGSLPDVGNATFAYLLSRYDGNGDRVITTPEYTRHDGQFGRWDRDGDGRLTQADWTEDHLQVNPQIIELQKRRVLGRHFQVDEDHALLSIDEMAEAFLDYYDGADGSTPDEELAEEEFRAAAPVHAVALPGDDSMQMQSYSGGMDPWSMLSRWYDLDHNGRVGLLELLSVFEEDDRTELRFDREHADAGEEEGLDYRVGLPAGTRVPNLELAALHGDAVVSLRDFVGQAPVALVFGSYT